MAIVVFILLSVLYQLFCVIINKGNLVFLISNELGADPLFIEIYIDENKVIEDDAFPTWWVGYSIKTKPKISIVKLKINGHESQEIRINAFFFTNIEVFYYGDTPFYKGGDRFKIIIRKRHIRYFLG